MKKQESGDPELILYLFFQLIDEILHFFDRFTGLEFIFDQKWRWDFCDWCYRYD